MHDDFEEDTTASISEEKPAPSTEINEVTIRSYPKTVLFYPTAFLSLIFAIITWILPFTPFALDPSVLYSIQALIGYAWFVVFGFNLFIITFEFSKGVVAIFVMLIVILIMAIAFIFQSTGILIFISPVAFGLFFSVNNLLAFFLIFSFIIIMSWISTRFYYFRITANEILYKKGLLGDVERYGTSNVSVHKEIRDIFEYILFLSGRLTIEIPGRKLAIVIDNVPKINNVELKIMTLLRRIEIDID
jgi:hypothetical protein